MAAWYVSLFLVTRNLRPTLMIRNMRSSQNINICCGSVETVPLTHEVSAAEISNLHRHRWDIEVFFKWIKQNITVKNLWGYSANAVKIHLWTAIISYLMVARIKADYECPYSTTEVATLIRISAMERTDLRSLLTKQDSSIKSNQNVKGHSLFDDF